MIAALIILLLLGGSGSSTLDLSDPETLAKFNQNVGTIISDPTKAARVSDAVYKLNVMSRYAYGENGLIGQDIQEFRRVAGDYNASRAEVHAALGQLDAGMRTVSSKTVRAREVIRLSTTKKEWNKLLKALSKK